MRHNNGYRGGRSRGTKGRGTKGRSRPLRSLSISGKGRGRRGKNPRRTRPVNPELSLYLNLWRSVFQIYNEKRISVSNIAQCIGSCENSDGQQGDAMSGADCMMNCINHILYKKIKDNNPY